MIRESRDTTWPFLCALFCLFVLSMAAPQIWQRSMQLRSGGPANSNSSDAADVTSGQSALAVWSVGAVDHAEPVAAPFCEGEVDIPSVAAMLGEMQVATPGPKYGHEVSADDWFDLELPEPVEVVEPVEMGEPVEMVEEGSLPQELDLAVEEGSLPPELDLAIEPEMEVLKDDRDMSRVEGVRVLLAEEISLLGPQGAQPGWSTDDGMAGRPESLLAGLDSVSWNCRTGEWARTTASLIRRLGMAMAAGSDEAVAIVDQLNESAARGAELADRLDEEPLASDVRDVCRVLAQRVELWRWVVLAGGPTATIAHRGPGDPGRTRWCLDRIDELLGDSAESAPWREFLELDRLREMASGSADSGVGRHRPLAIEVLIRLNRSDLTAQQREFIAGGPIEDLRAELQDWVGGPVNLGRLMERIERYEVTAAGSDAGRLAEDIVRLQLSPVERDRRFGARLQNEYARANVRIAVTREFLNRMVPPREEEYQWVRDRVMGLPVSGHQWTDTDVAVRMIPDPGRLRMALEIEGLVSSLTASSSGPATFHSDSQSTYRAQKEMELNTGGLHFQPAQVSVDNYTQLRSVETDLDGIPLFGSLAREIARSEHRKSRFRVRREVEEKVYRRAKQQIDEETEARLGMLSDRLTDGVIAPLAAMSVEPTMLSARTTEKRMAMELSLAGNVQLGSHTPRPWAPSDSLVSFQIHQSALNNLVAGLELDGNTFTLAELRGHLAERLNRPKLAEIETENDGASITFAEADAARVRFEDGRLTLWLSVARMKQARRAWSNFEVIVHYRAQLDGRSAQLVRDGVVQLRGRQNTRSQIALRGIFSSTFSKEVPWQVLPKSLAEAPSMEGLSVTQLDLINGWLGLALGPIRGGSRSSLAQRPGANAE